MQEGLGGGGEGPHPFTAWGARGDDRLAQPAPCPPSGLPAGSCEPRKGQEGRGAAGPRGSRTPNSLSHGVLLGTYITVRTQRLGLSSPSPGPRACQVPGAGAEWPATCRTVTWGSCARGRGGGGNVCPLPASLPQKDVGSKSRHGFKGLNSQVNPEVWNFQNVLAIGSSGASR